MKVFILGGDLSGEGPVWLNILWPFFNVFSEIAETTYVPIPHPTNQPRNRIATKIMQWQEIKERQIALVREVESKLDPSGPNLLFVIASGGHEVAWTRALDPVWDRFSHRVLHVCDTLQAKWVSEDLLARLDLVTCFCNDLARDFAARSSTPVLFLPAHCDTLNFGSISDFRPVDLIVVGRRDEALHSHLHAHFNDPSCNRVFIDFVTRTQGQTSCEREFRLLMATYARSAASFCYEPSQHARYNGASPLLARWVHAWTAGCSVFGVKPKGTGTAELMDWPESAIDLPSEPSEAADMVETLLSDTAGMAERRRRNLVEAMKRHDTRRRIELLLRKLSLPLPQKLEVGLERLAERRQDIDSGNSRRASKTG